LGLRFVLIAGCAAVASGCFVLENAFFPVWEPNFFATPPAVCGPFEVVEKRVEVADGADGQPFGITAFAPEGATGPVPMMLWVMGSNVQAYYQQSLHENLATWGYLVAVPDTRPLRFADLQYHNRIVLLAEQTLGLALEGALGPAIDPDRIAAGGYSVGAPLAAFTAARRPEIDGLVFWAPSGAPIWQGVDPASLYPQAGQSALYVLGELDVVSPPNNGFADELRAVLPSTTVDVEVIAGASHHQFQQPTGADDLAPPAAISRFEQQGIAIAETRLWLDEVL